MYFACWLALLSAHSAPSTHSQHFYNLAVCKTRLQNTLKILDFFILLRVIPGCFYCDCIGCWCRHWPLMTGDATLGAGVTTAAREQRRPLALVTWMRTLWVEGDGMWPLHSLSISVQTLGEVTSTQSPQVASSCHQGLSLTISRRRNWPRRSSSSSPQCSKVSRQDSEKQQSTQRSTWHLDNFFW